MSVSERFPVEFRNLGRRDYAETLEQMRLWTDKRDASTVDQIWQLEHDPVYTQGVSCTEACSHWPADSIQACSGDT
mgnify:CR=1 FL=1